MVMNWNIALAHVGPLSNLEGFVQGIEPDLWSHFCITDHSKTGEVHGFHLEDLGARVVYAPQSPDGSESCARAFNRAFRENPDVSIYCSVSCRFPDGLAQAVEAILACPADVIWGAWGGTSRHSVEKSGKPSVISTRTSVQPTAKTQTISVVGRLPASRR